MEPLALIALGLLLTIAFLGPMTALCDYVVRKGNTDWQAILLGGMIALPLAGVVVLGLLLT